MSVTFAASSSAPAEEKPFGDRRDALWQKGQSLFRTFDTDNNGYLEGPELSALFEEVHGQAPDNMQLMFMQEHLDTDGDGNISLEEFMWWFRHGLAIEALQDREAADKRLADEYATDEKTRKLGVAQAGPGPAGWNLADELPTNVSAPLLDALASKTVRMLRRFALWDVDGDGTVNQEEFVRACHSLGVPDLQDSEVATLFEYLDADGSGTVRFEELIKLKAMYELYDSEVRAGRLQPLKANRMSSASDNRGHHRGKGAALWQYTKETALGALWKQPLKPHHAMAIEPRESKKGTTAEALKLKKHEVPPPRRRYTYHPGPVPDVAEHCESAEKLLMDAAADSVHELGSLLSEVRQASMKTEEMHLGQPIESAEPHADEALAHFEIFLQSFAYSLESAVIMLERYGRVETEARTKLQAALHVDTVTKAKSASKMAAKTKAKAKKGAGARGSKGGGATKRKMSISMGGGSKGGGTKRGPPPRPGREKAAMLIQTMARGHVARKEVLRIKARATRPAAHGLAGRPLQRYMDTFAPAPGLLRQLYLMSQLYACFLVLYLICAAVVYGGDAGGVSAMREVCEFHHYAATTRPDSYERVNGTHLVLIDGAATGKGSGECGGRANSLSWGDASLNQTCDGGKVREGASYLWVPLPFLFVLSALPAWLWRGGNTTFGMWYKLIAETPSVPLILLQCLFRAIVLTTVISDAYDTTYYTLEAVQEWILLIQVFVFIFMDSMTQPAPKLRTLFALVLCARFLQSYATRTFGPNIPAEQHPLFPQDGVFEGMGRTTRQTIIAGIDWTVVLLMATSLSSVFLHPRELAFVRLRCDVLSYINWRDHFVRRMMVRGNRRHEDLEDAMLFLRAKMRGLFRRQGGGRLPVHPPDEVRV